MGKIIKAVILAGGKGERLKPLTQTIPKPMVKIGSVPILEHNILILKKGGIDDIVISLCYLPEVIQNHFGDGKKWNVKISYISEPQNSPLGTAGSVGLLRTKINDTFIVSYGDSLRQLDVKKLIKLHLDKKGIGTICLHKNTNKKPKSIVEFNNMGGIISFRENPSTKIKKIPWSNAGFYVFEPEVFSFIPENVFFDFAKDVFPAIIRSPKKLFSYPLSGYFLDIGNVDKFNQANKDIDMGIFK